MPGAGSSRRTPRSNSTSNAKPTVIALPARSATVTRISCGPEARGRGGQTALTDDTWHSAVMSTSSSTNTTLAASMPLMLSLNPSCRLGFGSSTLAARGRYRLDQGHVGRLFVTRRHRQDAERSTTPSSYCPPGQQSRLRGHTHPAPDLPIDSRVRHRRPGGHVVRMSVPSRRRVREIEIDAGEIVLETEADIDETVTKDNRPPSEATMPSKGESSSFSEPSTRRSNSRTVVARLPAWSAIDTSRLVTTWRWENRHAVGLGGAGAKQKSLRDSPSRVASKVT